MRVRVGNHVAGPFLNSIMQLTCPPKPKAFDNVGLVFLSTHMNDLVSCGIEYKITQDKGTHAIAPGFVYCCGLAFLFHTAMPVSPKFMHVLLLMNTLRACMLLSPPCSVPKCDPGNVQSSLTHLDL